MTYSLLCILIFTDRVSMGGNAIASVRPSVCLSVRFHSTCNFSIEWLLALTFCMCNNIGHDNSSHGIKGQGQWSRLGLGLGLESQFETRSVWPRSSIKDSFLVLYAATKGVPRFSLGLVTGLLTKLYLDINAKYQLYNTTNNNNNKITTIPVICLR